MRSRRSLSRTRNPDRLRLGVAVAAAAMVGCSSAASDESGPGGPVARTADAGGPAGDGGVAASCSAASACKGTPISENGVDSFCVRSVETSLRLPGGAPAPGRVVLVCGKNVCAKGKSDAQGRVTMPLCLNMFQPAMKLVGGSEFVTFTVPVRSATTTFPPITLVPLGPPGSPLSAGASATSFTSNGVTLSVPAGAKVDPNELENPEPEDKLFRAARVRPEEAPPCVDTAAGPQIVYGLGPPMATVSPPAALALPNDLGWPAGAAVELRRLAIDPAEANPQGLGTWVPMGTGHVSADGHIVATDPGPGNGVPALSMVVARKK